MSTRMLDRVWQTVDVTGAELLLLLSYADICDDQGNGIWCSDEYTMWKTGIGRTTLVDTKKKWREMGVLCPVGFYHLESRQSVRSDVNVVPGVGGRGWTILYQLCLDPLPTKSAWKEGRAKKVPINGTFNTGQKVPPDGTLPDSEGAGGRTERCRSADEKVPVGGQEGAETHCAYKEDPLVEPLGNPLDKNHHGLRRDDVEVWLAIKEEMRKEIGTEEWNLWVRPGRLLRVMSGSYFLIAFPPNGNILQTAAGRKQLLDEVAQRFGKRALQTVYPDDWEAEQAKLRFEVELPVIGRKKA